MFDEVRNKMDEEPHDRGCSGPGLVEGKAACYAGASRSGMRHLALLATRDANAQRELCVMQGRKQCQCVRGSTDIAQSRKPVCVFLLLLCGAPPLTSRRRG